MGHEFGHHFFLQMTQHLTHQGPMKQICISQLGNQWLIQIMACYPIAAKQIFDSTLKSICVLTLSLSVHLPITLCISVCFHTNCLVSWLQTWCIHCWTPLNFTVFSQMLNTAKFTSHFEMATVGLSSFVCHLETINHLCLLQNFIRYKWLSSIFSLSYDVSQNSQWALV